MGCPNQRLNIPGLVVLQIVYPVDKTVVYGG